MKTIMILTNLFLLSSLLFSLDPIHSAKSYCILDSTGNKIKAFNELTELAPASTIKLITAMVVLDNVPLDKQVTATKSVRGIESIHIEIKAGEVFSCQDLLKALLIRSANDSAIVLAEGVAGSISKFAGMMNEKAKAIGCQRSNFINPHGITAKGQYSCAYDLALIALASTKYPKIQELLSCKETSIFSQAGRKIDLKNGNKLLEKGSIPVFGKTGYTYAAQNTFSGFCNIDGKIVGIGIMGSPERSYMWKEIISLLGIRPKVEIKNLDGIEMTNQNIQILLQTLGYYEGKIDGSLGTQSQASIKKFQHDHKLKVDGKVGKQTWNALLEAAQKQTKPNNPTIQTTPPPVPPKPTEKK